MRSRYLIEAAVALSVFAMDQVTKLWVLSNIALYQVIEIIPGFFNLVHFRNRGAAFGLLNRPDLEWTFWLFLCATIAAVALILHMTRHSPFKMSLFIGFGAIMGGALGNLADRIRFRSVIDFLDFYVGAWHWPTFNIADSAICAGAVLVFIALCGRESVKKAK
jgi:signal peptidase II